MTISPSAGNDSSTTSSASETSTRPFFRLLLLLQLLLLLLLHCSNLLLPHAYPLVLQDPATYTRAYVKSSTASTSASGRPVEHRRWYRICSFCRQRIWRSCYVLYSSSPTAFFLTVGPARTSTLRISFSRNTSVAEVAGAAHALYVMLVVCCYTVHRDAHLCKSRTTLQYLLRERCAHRFRETAPM